MDVQIVSDLHSENGKFDWEPVVPTADVLVVAGDLGNLNTPFFSTYLETLSRKFTSVLYVLGNHELYTSPYKPTSYDEVISKIEDLCDDYGNVHLLNRGVVEIGQYSFLGCTLWSAIDVDHATTIEHTIRDYRKIYVKDSETKECRRLNTLDVVKMHYQDLNWLEERLEENERVNKKSIVITHHAPTIVGIDINRRHTSLVSAYYSNLEYLMHRHTNLPIWIHGHSHFSHATEIGNTTVISNPLGYNRQSRFYDSKYVLHLL